MSILNNIKNLLSEPKVKLYEPKPIPEHILRDDLRYAYKTLDNAYATAKQKQDANELIIYAKNRGIK